MELFKREQGFEGGGLMSALEHKRTLPNTLIRQGGIHSGRKFLEALSVQFPRFAIYKLDDPLR